MNQERDGIFSLAGETALITGGGTGLGFGIATAFVKAGARVVLAGRREAELAKAAKALGPAASFVVHDITQLDRAGDLLKAAGVPVSILVNNAGINLKKRAVETTAEDFKSVLDTNVMAAHALTRAALPGMIERKHGNVLFIASMASLFGIPQVFAYTAAKSSVVGMTRALAVELGDCGVRVNSIAPGWIESDMTKKAMSGDPARFERICKRTPLGRFGQADDIGWAAVYLCSRAAKFVTGTTLVVDGGISIGF